MATQLLLENIQKNIFLRKLLPNKKRRGCGKENLKCHGITESQKKKLNCNILDVDRYKRLIGECFKRNINLNSWMVSNGYAVAYRKYSKKYVSDEINAKNNKLGIWQGKFEMPWDYRRKN